MQRFRDAVGKFTRKPRRYGYINLTGEVFGRLRVIRFAGWQKNNAGVVRRVWLCRCSCKSGRRVLATTSGLRSHHHPVRSCGCLHAEARQRLRVINTVHGHARQGHHSKTFDCWQSMIQRTTNPNCRTYHKYGAKGVRVCKRWQGPKGFINFLADMGPKPSVRYSISRLGDIGDYKPSNVFWHTRKQQQAEANKKRRLKAMKAGES